MKYHDYHLRGYSVSDFGKTITLDLVFDYPNSTRDESQIRFSDVIVYSLIHTGAAIITNIFETPLSKISKEMESDLIEWAWRHGGEISRQGDIGTCKMKLEKEGYKLWTIASAIGFSGAIISKSVT